jgi:hypothetical protein
MPCPNQIMLGKEASHYAIFTIYLFVPSALPQYLIIIHRTHRICAMWKAASFLLYLDQVTNRWLLERLVYWSQPPWWRKHDITHVSLRLLSLIFLCSVFFKWVWFTRSILVLDCVYVRGGPTNTGCVKVRWMTQYGRLLSVIIETYNFLLTTVVSTAVTLRGPQCRMLLLLLLLLLALNAQYLRTPARLGTGVCSCPLPLCRGLCGCAAVEWTA